MKSLCGKILDCKFRRLCDGRGKYYAKGEQTDCILYEKTNEHDGEKTYDYQAREGK